MIHYRVKWGATNKHWQNADAIVLSSHEWNGGHILNLDYAEAEAHLQSLGTRGTLWQIQRDGTVWEGATVRCETQPVARVCCVTVR